MFPSLPFPSPSLCAGDQLGLTLGSSSDINGMEAQQRFLDTQRQLMMTQALYPGMMPYAGMMPPQPYPGKCTYALKVECISRQCGIVV